MNLSYNTQYPSIEDLRRKAKSKIPRFVYEYMDGGCNDDVNLAKNTNELSQVELMPYYLNKYTKATTKTELFGEVYDAPFGVAPIGLQGLIWPNAPEILAKAAVEHNVPFTLSTVSTSSIERIGEITNGKFWYQLYHPADNKLRDDILDRAEAAGCKVLVLLSDVPTFGFRPRDIRNGLAMPPRMTLSNIIQIFGRPMWGINTLIHGQPGFATMKKYMPKGLDMSQLGAFMNQTFEGRLNEQKINEIRERWKGKIVLKGVSALSDVDMVHKLGLDGVIVSNHGGRQIDAGPSAIKTLGPIVEKYKGKMKIMMDSGVRTGPDIARTMALGADFAFLGRSFMYSVAALGTNGGQHMMSLLKIQLEQVMNQICCEKCDDLPNFLI